MHADIDVAISKMSKAEIILSVEDVLDFIKANCKADYDKLLRKIKETIETKTKRSYT